MKALCACSLLCALQFAGGCSPPEPDVPGAATVGMRYDPGDPFFDIQPVASVLPEGSGVEVLVEFLYAGFTFVRAGNGFEAAFEVSIRIRDRETDSLEMEQAWPETLRVGTYRETQSADRFLADKVLPVRRGSYMVEVVVEDRNSGTSGTRREAVTVPDLNHGEPFISGPILCRRDTRGMLQPIVLFHVPSSGDTLFTQVRLFNLPASAAVAAELLLTRFVVDTTAAVPPYYYSSASGDYRSRSLYPERVDTVFRQGRRGTFAEGAAGLTLAIPPLDPGLYRMQLAVQRIDDAQASWTIGRGRYFAVMSPSFPRLGTFAEMGHAVRYIATDSERDSLATARTQAESRRFFDEFWLSRMPDRRLAAETVKRYSGRIEEANRFFSTYKEGWKTDRGMIYTIMGPPERVEHNARRETWYYTSTEKGAAQVWQFRSVEFAPANLSVTEYLLVRGRGYTKTWMSMISRWREGKVF
jgi:GWxTD domain-containing protein